MRTEIDYFKNAKTCQIKLFGATIFAFYSVKGLGWFRIFGVGAHWKDVSLHRLCSSERNGYKSALKIGKYRISFLPKN
jgi:hypothetical protein